MSSNFCISEKPTHTLSEFEFIHDPNDKNAKLGVGSFASVKLAREKKTGKLFALKVMNISPLKASASDLHNLKAEITIHKKLDNSNIVKFHGYIQQDPFVYIILDYAEGGNLYTHIHKKKYLTDSEVFKYFYQTCLAINYCHNNNVMHRDLKPENLLLDKNQNIKLCDFGWSTQNINDKRLTFCGTYEYMAPEIVHKTPYDYRIDVWSLGVLLFELIHREAPYKGRSLTEITKSLNRKTITFSSSTNPEAKDLILRILRINPSERISIQNILAHPYVKGHLAQEDPKSFSAAATEVVNPASLKNAPVKPQIKLADDSQTGSSSYKTAASASSMTSLPESTRHNTHHHTSPLVSTTKAQIQAAAQAYTHSHHQHTQSTYLTTSKAQSLTQLDGFSSQPTSHHKVKDPQRYKIVTQESPSKESILTHPVKSPSIGHLSGMNTGNLTTRDKENRDFMSFVSYNDLAKQRKEASSGNSSYISLRTLTDHYPTSATHMQTKTGLSASRHHTDNGIFQPKDAKTTKQKGIFDNSHLSPLSKLKINDIMTHLNHSTAPRSDIPQTTTNSSYSSSIKSPVSRPFGSSTYKLNSNTFAPKIVETGKISEREVKLQAPRSRVYNSTELRSGVQTHHFKQSTGQDYSSSNSFSKNSSGSGFYNPRSPVHRQEENSPMVGGSYNFNSSASNILQNARNNFSNIENEVSSAKLEYSTSTKNLKEADINAICSNNKPDVELSAKDSTFNQFYKGLESRKRVEPSARGISNKENEESSIQKMLHSKGPLFRVNV